MPFGYEDPTPAEIASACQALKDLGVATVDLAFSGGNDEGGVDDVTYRDAAGNEVEGIASSNAYEGRYWKGGAEHSTGWQVWDRSLSGDFNKQNRPATEEEIRVAKLHKILAAPIYARYYTFAGEFHVNGNLHWDVEAGTHEMTGQESHEVWEEIGY